MAQTFLQGSQQYLSNIDAEITRLQQLRQQVAAETESSTKNSPPRKKRVGMSEEGRRRIAEAQKKRWAKQGKKAEADAAAKGRPAKRIAAKRRVARTTGSSAISTEAI